MATLVPDYGEFELGKTDGQGAKSNRLIAGVNPGKALGYGGHQFGLGDDGEDGSEVRRVARNLPGLAAPSENAIHQARATAPVENRGVTFGEKGLAGDRAAPKPGMAGGRHAHIAFAPKNLAQQGPMRGGGGSVESEREVESALFQVGLGWQKQAFHAITAQHDARRSLGDVFQESRQDESLGVIIQPDRELTGCTRGIECGRGRKEAPYAGKGGNSQGCEPGTLLGQFHPRTPPLEQRIAEQSTQPAKCIAHRRLAETNPASCAGHTAFFEQGFEGNQEIQIDGSKIHLMNGYHIKHP